MSMYDIRGAQWQNETWLGESVTLTRGELKSAMREYADERRLMFFISVIVLLTGLHALYCLFLTSLAVQKTIEAHVRLRIWGGVVWLAIVLYMFIAFGLINAWNKCGASAELASYASLSVSIPFIHAVSFLQAKRLAAEHGLSMRDAFDIDLLRWFRPRTLLPT